MNISLTPELESLVQEQVKSGMYHSASEVIRDALRMFEERVQLREIKLERLRKEIAIGLEQAERGQVAPMNIEHIKAEGRRRLKEGR